MLRFLTSRSENRFAFLHIHDDGKCERTSFTLASGVADKKITFLAHEKFSNLKDIYKEQSTKRIPLKLIVGVSPRNTARVRIPIVLKREVPDRPISSAELENILSERLGIAFNHSRQEASQKLKIPESHTVLVESHIEACRIDGHEVFGLAGFQGEKIEAVIELIFVSRALYDYMEFLFNDARGFFFTDMARASLFALRRAGAGHMGFVAIGEEYSVVYPESGLLQTKGAREIRIKWGYAHLYEALARAWDTNPQATEKLYDIFRRGELSTRMAQFFKDTLEKPLNLFFETLRGLKLKGKVFTHTTISLPFEFPKRTHAYILYDVPYAMLWEHSGFSVEGEAVVPREASDMLIAPFLQFYYDNRGETAIDQWLRRRLQWLGAISYRRVV